jgi:hypothetical protein
MRIKKNITPPSHDPGYDWHVYSSLVPEQKMHLVELFLVCLVLVFGGVMISYCALLILGVAMEYLQSLV